VWLYRNLDANALALVLKEENSLYEFTAPEMSQGSSKDAAADMWSLGMICFHLLVGESPYKKSTKVKSSQSNSDTLKIP
jgi:serine/threonine protein kinase